MILINVDIDGVTFDDQVGDRVLYPADSAAPVYTIQEIIEADDYNVTYVLSSENYNDVPLKVPFDDCIHIESQMAMIRHQMKIYEGLSKTLEETFPLYSRFNDDY